MARGQETAGDLRWTAWRIEPLTKVEAEPGPHRKWAWEAAVNMEAPRKRVARAGPHKKPSRRDAATKVSPPRRTGRRATKDTSKLSLEAEPEGDSGEGESPQEDRQEDGNEAETPLEAGQEGDELQTER